MASTPCLRHGQAPGSGHGVLCGPRPWSRASFTSRPHPDLLPYVGAPAPAPATVLTLWPQVLFLSRSLPMMTSVGLSPREPSWVEDPRPSRPVPSCPVKESALSHKTLFQDQPWLVPFSTQERCLPAGRGPGVGSRICPPLSQDARSQCLPPGRRWTGHRWHATDVWCTWAICVSLHLPFSVGAAGQAPAASIVGATLHGAGEQEAWFGL